MITKIVQRMLQMCPMAWYIFKRGMQLCVVLLFAALVVLYERGAAADTYRLTMLASALNETAQAVLLICVLASVIIEDVSA